MEKSKLEKTIRDLNPWFCPIKINGISITPGIGSKWSGKKLANRINFRHKLLVDEVVERYDFTEKRILDLACNCGYWSARYAEKGASYVLGIEGRDKVCKQAKLYWEYNNFLVKEKYEFICGNVIDSKIWKKIEAQEKFDVTLCAGILYHIPNYRDLLKRIAKVTKEVIIIDTRVGPSNEKVIVEPGDLCFNAIEQTLTKVVPNLQKLIKYLGKLNFSCEILPVTFKSPIGLRDQDDYNEKRRVTILARRTK